MINISNKQGKYRIRPTVPDDTEYIQYYVYWGQPNEPIYVGRSRYFGDYEVDLTDWVDWVIGQYDGYGTMAYYGDLIVDFVFVDSEGVEHMGPEDRYEIPIKKEKTELVYSPSVSGVVDFNAPLNKNLNPKIHIGGKPRLVDSFGVWVFPVFFLENVYDGRKAMLDPLFLANSYGEQEWNVNIKDFWTNDSSYEKDTIAFTYELIDLFDRFSGSRADEKGMNGFDPVIFYEDGEREFYTTTMFGTYEPLFYMWDMEDYQVGEGHLSYRLKQPYTIRYKEEDMVKWYETNVSEDVRSDYNLTGYGYSVIYIYPQYLSPVGSDNNPMRIDYHLVGSEKMDGCPYFNLLLMNSDIEGDVNVPLQVQNGILKGKSTNRLDKVEYMDIYGDTHNSSVTNSYELECFVDSEWLKTMTGEDLGYEELMMAMQSSRKSLLIGNGKISGMRTDGDTILDCRVKDIEKVDTHSRYNGNNRVPSLRITLEIYK